MWDLTTLMSRNEKLWLEYLASTPPRERLERSLDALQRTSAVQTARILAAFDAASSVEQLRIADEMSVDELLVRASP